MSYPDNLNGDVFRRMEASNLDFWIGHTVDTHAFFTKEEAAILMAGAYCKNESPNDSN